MTAQIKRVQRGTNGELIATAQHLYRFGDRVLDLTPGEHMGMWNRLVPLDLRLLPPGRDFRRLSSAGGAWTDVIFDPPYVAKGGHKTSSIGEMNARYGMLHVEKNPRLQWQRQILPGLSEAHRLLEIGGRLWFKCMDYVTNGSVYWFTKMALPELERRGFELVDEFILDGEPGPQPTTTRCKACKGLGVTGDLNLCTRCAGHGEIARRQVHARNAHSVLMIAAKR